MEIGCDSGLEQDRPVGSNIVTVYDVARRAGVSPTTVSHVLNGTRPVSDDLRARVLAARDELGFEPSAVARSLKVRRSNTIGLVVADIANPFFPAVVRGVEDVAQGAGYTVIVGNSDEDPDKEVEYLRVLYARRVDGLILAPTGQRHQYLQRLARANFPLVFVDREVPDLGVSSVVVDSETATRNAVRHLINLGHRRIAMVSGRPRISSAVDRIRGYREALDWAGIPVDERLNVSGGARADEARAAAEALLDLDPPPTAFFVANNMMTIGVMRAVRARGLRVPQDVAVVGFDDFEWADVFEPRLTTVAQPTYDLGRVAAEMLLEKIDGSRDGHPEHRVLACHLVIRDSCGASLTTTPLLGGT